jgi:hypothetical protein
VRLERRGIARQYRSRCEAHDGQPAAVKGTGGGDAGVLRIDFPGGAGTDELDHLSWDDWFSTFDDSGLAFLYQGQKATGEDSTFFKLVNR